ncbi:MAG: class I SAM-dependent methyltransferase [Candidatus Methylomirabilales bacterium]
MTRSRVLGSVLVCVSLLFAGGAGLAQDPAGTKEYAPVEGQQGKDVIWLPSALTVVNKMLDLAGVTPRDYVIDLGSGDGRLVITAAKRGARALGIEYNPDLVELSRRHAAREGVSERARFVKADIFESDFSQATVITMFLLPELNLKLRPQLLQLAPGTRIVSNTFTMGDWEADETAVAEQECTTYCTALLWIVPARVGGAWKLSGGELTLRQTYQTVSGQMSASGRRVPLAKGRLRGSEIAFTVGGAEYTGRVEGKTMRGTVKQGGRTSPWSATRLE